jgi:hypothetical protein
MIRDRHVAAKDTVMRWSANFVCDSWTNGLDNLVTGALQAETEFFVHAVDKQVVPKPAGVLPRFYANQTARCDRCYCRFEFRAGIGRGAFNV